MNSACTKFLDIDPPKSKVESDVVFEDDLMAGAALLGVYAGMLNNKFITYGDRGVLALTGLSSDELRNNGTSDPEMKSFQSNDLIPENPYLYDIWSYSYTSLYRTNAVIEGLQNSKKILEDTKKQLRGEALFIRGLIYFYMVNLFGDVPLVLTTDYEINSKVTRTPKAAIYAQVLKDLLEASEILGEDYPAANKERIRANKAVAEALLARVYLYQKDWTNAEKYANLVIDRTTVYKLNTDLDKAFLKNNSEAVWQIRPMGYLDEPDKGRAPEAEVFSPIEAPEKNVLTEDLVRSFEPGDARMLHWVDTIPMDADTLWHPVKYKIYGYDVPLDEYSMIIRLAEIILIRAEARAMQDKLTGPNSAASDIDSIRVRAKLAPTTAATLPAIMAAIEQERRVELFAEVGGHRWFDLIRWNRADAVLGPKKGAKWASTDVLYPLPRMEMDKNPFLKPQNDGY